MDELTVVMTENDELRKRNHELMQWMHAYKTPEESMKEMFEKMEKMRMLYWAGVERRRELRKRLERVRDIVDLLDLRKMKILLDWFRKRNRASDDHGVEDDITVWMMAIHELKQY